MVYKMIVNLGFLALGYYLGREVGRTEAIREQLARARKSGETINLREAVTIDMEESVKQDGQQSVKH